MAWFLLFVAGLLETAWAYSMKQSQGFTRLWPTVITLVTVVASFGLLATAMKSLPLGTAYMIWTGIGAVGAFLVEIAWMGGQATAMRIVAALMIVGGLLIMKLTSAA